LDLAPHKKVFIEFGRGLRKSAKKETFYLQERIPLDFSRKRTKISSASINKIDFYNEKFGKK